MTNRIDSPEFPPEEYSHLPKKYLEKLNTIARQTREMMDKNRPFVRCECGKKLWPHRAYRCLYCGEWYCKECAEIHFGQTMEEYRKENPIEEMYADD